MQLQLQGKDSTPQQVLGGVSRLSYAAGAGLGVNRLRAAPN